MGAERGGVPEPPPTPDPALIILPVVMKYGLNFSPLCQGEAGQPHLLFHLRQLAGDVWGVGLEAHESHSLPVLIPGT